MQTINLHQLSRALVLLVVPALLAAGCGGSSTGNNKSTSQNSEAQALKWTQCMQQHGINGVSMSASGIPTMTGSAPIDEQQLRAAGDACKKYRPNGGQVSGGPSAQQVDQMAKFVQCLNQHGVPAQQQGAGNRLAPGTDPSKVQQAQQACQHYLNGSGPPAGQPSSGS
jgi:hypothetical protein